MVGIGRGGLRVSSAGKWLAALAGPELAYVDAERRIFAELMWDEQYGDRHTAMTILLCGASAAEIRDGLDGALLTDDELASPGGLDRIRRSVRGLARRPLRSHGRWCRRRTGPPDPGSRPRMKPDIHPDYHSAVFQDATTGATFLTRSTITSSRTIEWKTPQGARTYPLVVVEVTSDSHPFWTGGRRIVDTAGQVEKFRRRYGSRQSPA